MPRKGNARGDTSLQKPEVEMAVAAFRESERRSTRVA